MENYVKGNNVEEPDTIDTFGISYEINPEAFVIISGRTNTRSLFLSSLKVFKDHGMLAVTGSGPNCKKVVTLIEKVKRRYKKTTQYTQIHYKEVREFWDPKTEDLDQLMVLREIPRISILLVNVPIKNSEEEEEEQVPPQDSKSNLFKFCGVTSPKTAVSKKVKK